MSQPNILILLCDQMQHDRMGFMNEVSHTPNLDRLAAEGVQFTHAITQHGQCVPSRAAFLTGQNAHECGVMMNYGFRGHRAMLTEKHNTLAEVLQNEGYRNVYFGKGHIGEPVETVLQTLGYEEGKVYDEVKVEDEQAGELGIAHVHKSLRQSYVAAADALRFMQDYEPDGRPLFLTFSSDLPHPAFFTEVKYAHLFPPEQVKLPKSFYAETFEEKPAFIKAHCEKFARTEEQHRATNAQYETMIAMLDEHMGAIMEQFKEHGLWENTLVLFFADHGEMMGAHRLLAKGTLPYDELYRIPCIWKFPAGMTSQRKVIDDLVSSTAFAGTLLKLAGVPTPDSFTGGDLMDSFRRDRHPDGEAVFFEHYGAWWGGVPLRGIRTRTHKFVYYYTEGLTEFYDLEKDPHELLGQPHSAEEKEVQERLREQLEDWWVRTGGREPGFYESDEYITNRHNQT